MYTALNLASVFAENCQQNGYIPPKSVILSVSSNDARYLTVYK